MAQNQQQKIILFDGHNILFRYFWGMPRTLVTKTGSPCHGAYGFISAILAHIRKFMPSSAIVCFDSAGPPDRTSKSVDYKANRQWAFTPGDSENPFTQLPFIYAALDFLRISWVEIPGQEGDDLIGSYSKIATGQNLTAIIASADTDLLQLVSPTVLQYTKRGKQEIVYTPESVKALYGVEPYQIVDYKTLVGDAADNIQGVRGVGPKTAARLLNAYSSIENIYNNLYNIQESVVQSLLLSKADVFLNRELIQVNTTLQLDPSLMASRSISEFANKTAKSIFQELEIW
jgi:5'-3' exonuclease